MKNINIKGIGEKIAKNLGWLFFACFLILVLMEILEINTSFQMILSVNQEPEVGNKDRGVRINFDNYNEVVNKIKSAETFQPTGGITKNPFNPGSPVNPAPSPAPQASGGGGGSDSSGVLQLP